MVADDDCMDDYLTESKHKYALQHCHTNCFYKGCKIMNFGFGIL